MLPPRAKRLLEKIETRYCAVSALSCFEGSRHAKSPSLQSRVLRAVGVGHCLPGAVIGGADGIRLNVCGTGSTGTRGTDTGSTGIGSIDTGTGSIGTGSSGTRSIGRAGAIHAGGRIGRGR